MRLNLDHMSDWNPHHDGDGAEKERRVFDDDDFRALPLLLPLHETDGLLVAERPELEGALLSTTIHHCVELTGNSL